MDPLVSTAWLAGTLGAPDLRLFDATYLLPDEPGDARESFRTGHLPGARFFDVDAVADPGSDLPHMAPTAALFAELAGALGIGDGDRVIFYDQKGLFSAARGWWLLRLFGHDRVAVLDGGLPRWRAEGRALESGEPGPAALARFTPDFRPRLLRDLEQVRRDLEGRALVLDARAAGRFAGTAPEPRPGVPSGHMPGSANLPFAELLAPDGTMLPPDRLRARLAAAGVDGTRPVVASCGTGLTACVLALGLARAGLPDAAVFDGAWTEWATRADTPRAGGESV